MAIVGCCRSAVNEASRLPRSLAETSTRATGPVLWVRAARVGSVFDRLAGMEPELRRPRGPVVGGGLEIPRIAGHYGMVMRGAVVPPHTLGGRTLAASAGSIVARGDREGRAEPCG